MTLKTWKEEFYPVKPAKRMTKIEAIEHSLTKWRGLTKTNLNTHDLKVDYWNSKQICEEKNPNKFLNIDNTSCALCYKFFIPDRQDYQRSKCENCPLYQANEYIPCDSSYKSPYRAWVDNSNPRPMIKLLERALKSAQRELVSLPLK